MCKCTPGIKTPWCGKPGCERPAQRMGEETMFLDCNGTPIRLGDVVRAPVTGNRELHGEWADYRVRKAPGGYAMSYLRSEKGQVLPEGYTAGYMADQLPSEDEHDLKTLLFTLRPIRVRQWQVQG